jgi:hypothetical protein
MGLNSARLSLDPVLERCFAGAHRMHAPEENLSVMRVQEALDRLGFASGAFDGIFGDATGAAVSAFKASRGLEPTDPVVGPGTSGQLDAELFVDPPSLDPAFGEVAPFVAAHAVEPFVGMELAPLIDAPLNTQRHDLGGFMRSALNSGQCLAIVAHSRIRGVQDNRIPAAIIDHIDRDMRPDAAGITVDFDGTDGQEHVAIAFNDLTIRGRMSLTHHPTGRKAKIDLRAVLCHELTHMRNKGLGLENTPTFDTETFLDPNLAANLSQATGRPTARVFFHFAHEMNARHVNWIIERENAGDPFAAQFLQPVALSEAAHFYFAETDPELFNDNGYIPGILAQGHAATYRQIGLWLRQCANMTFSGNAEAQQIIAQLFRDAADSAELTAVNPDLARPQGDGLFPLANDFH